MNLVGLSSWLFDLFLVLMHLSVLPFAGPRACALGVLHARISPGQARSYTIVSHIVQKRLAIQLVTRAVLEVRTHVCISVVLLLPFRPVCVRQSIFMESFPLLACLSCIHSKHRV